MSDNEKLDLILEKISCLETDLREVKQKVGCLETDLREVKQKVGRLENGQSGMKRELFRIDRKISDTYNLALDAWGQSTENRELLES